MEHANDTLFLAINAGSHPPGFLLLMALFLANWLVPLTILLFVLLWIRKPDRERAALITATLTMLIGLAVNQIIGMVYFHPRPFMVGLGHQYLPHPADNSFPSDHATFMWSLGFGLLALGMLRGWAVTLIAGGIAVAWARIYVGVHFPFDMAGSLLVALTVTGFARLIHRLVRRWLAPPCVRLYENAIRLFRLPPLLFPQQPTPVPLQRHEPDRG
jgi:undecaprenyl-diphosphatase